MPPAVSSTASSSFQQVLRPAGDPSNLSHLMMISGFTFGNGIATLRADHTSPRDPMPSPLPPILGTTLFDGDQARKGYAPNKMRAFLFNDEANRKAFSDRRRGLCASTA